MKWRRNRIETFSEQICYERELFSAIDKEAKRHHSTVFQKETTMERLSEALPVLNPEEE